MSRRDDDSSQGSEADGAFPPAAGPARGLRILAIDVPAPMVETVGRQTGATVEAAPFSGLDLALMARVMPDAVFAPLMGPGFDILDLATRLARLGYGGSLHGLTGPLPDPEAIAREIRSHCEGIDFELVVLAG